MRFTLSAALGLTAFLAVICFLATTTPGIVSYVLLLAIALLAPVAAIAGIVYGRDNLRAFCMGAIVPLALLVWSSESALTSISLSPADYGWSVPPDNPPRPRGNEQDKFDPEDPFAEDVGFELKYTTTKMRAPTVTLSVAAVLSGLLVMAIRGGLMPRDRDKRPGESATA